MLRSVGLLHSDRGVLAVLVSLLVLGLYATSFFLPAFTLVFDSEEVVRGWWAFVFVPKALASAQPSAGTVSGLEGEVAFIAAQAFGWLPNPLLWVGVYSLWTGRRAAAATAGALALYTALAWYLPHHALGLIRSLHLGFFLWAASMATLTAAAASSGRS